MATKANCNRRQVRMTAENPFAHSVGSRVRAEPFMQMLSPQYGDNILDVGCGLGYFTDMLNSNGAVCTGIDLDEECIEYCLENMLGRYKIADVTKLPFRDNSFNKVLCTEVLEHVQENGVILDEIVRVTCDNGTVVVSTPCSSGMFKGLFKRIGHSNVDSNSREYHYHKGYTKDSLGELLLEHKILPVETHYTLVAWAEIYMALTKIVVQALMRQKIHSQANALRLTDTLAWKINCKTLPAVMSAIKLEQRLSNKLKGHMIIMKGVVCK
jgi:2-polyprenyl-3-methyl-5-hydroxy-6-metoxy-1,4-benzoquinol methylase